MFPHGPVTSKLDLLFITSGFNNNFFYLESKGIMRTNQDYNFYHIPNNTQRFKYLSHKLHPKI